jgi:hypothetical protein
VSTLTGRAVEKACTPRGPESQPKRQTKRKEKEKRELGERELQKGGPDLERGRIAACTITKFNQWAGTDNSSRISFMKEKQKSGSRDPKERQAVRRQVWRGNSNGHLELSNGLDASIVLGKAKRLEDKAWSG